MKLRNKALAVLLLVSCLMLGSMAPDSAAGRVYSHEEIAVCRQLSSIKGVYAVYARHDASLRTKTFDIVLTPGSKATSVADSARNILEAKPGEKWVLAVVVDIYTYRDPTKTEDFRRTFNAGEFMTSVYGFPDYRAALSAEARGSYDPATGLQQGAWTVKSIYTDPALFTTGE